MTDGGKIARRNGRPFAEEYDRPHEKKSPDTFAPVTREREEKKPEICPRSRESSFSTPLVPEFEMEPLKEDAQQEEESEGNTCPSYWICQKFTGLVVIPAVGGLKIFEEKIEGRPLNFGIVVPGIYRSGYPQTEDHDYLRSLGLKTIVYAYLPPILT
jgi:hypothetical protein